ncbi:serine hydrolase domain-containing protein [Phytohabitans rumicis]|uniref:Beta-lactamase-related domain-containing protein n=1 Tax=Phytohabitans rumicis TaxID=1076125 RepID=A0A6V8LGT2_9ACTN|nr:serine hydrolase domain-containing protein [Phytohabitans rumicis]GFJ94850.1 hypothetical protein Prum_084920 [Phytohabitans rumicis]
MNDVLERLVAGAVADPGGPGCVVGLVRPGEPLVTARRGLANLEHRVPITDDTVFHVASVSKQFTAYAVAALAQDGKLGMDDPVAAHLPWFPFPDITLDHLVRHTSGLRDQWEMVEAAGRRMEDVITTADVVRMVAAQRTLNFSPGDRYAYCNTGYTLLGLVVEAVSGQPLREFCAERVFEPLRMTRTRFVDDHQEVVEDRADSYATRPAGGYRRIALSYATAGATSLNTTVGDLARWAAHTMTPPMRALRETGAGYGLGVHVDTTGVWHAGADAGFRSHFLVLPDAGVAGIVLANHAGVDTERLCAAAVGIPEPAPKPAPTASVGTADRVAPAAYPGIFYCDEADAHVRLVDHDGALCLARPTLAATPLRPVGPETFEVDVAGDERVTLVLGADHLLYSTDGARNLRFDRIR